MKLTAFRFERKDTTFATAFTIGGSISEESAFPVYQARPSAQTVTVDLYDVGLVNSWGIRLWMKWIWSLTEAHASGRIYLDRCPPGVVKQMLVVQNFLPPNVEVRSLFLPYDCSSCGESMRVLVRREDAALRETLLSSDADEHSVPCPKCGAAALVDVHPEHYLRAFR